MKKVALLCCIAVAAFGQKLTPEAIANPAGAGALQPNWSATPDGGVVAPVAAYLKDVQACGRRCARMGWTCCGVSGSTGLRAWNGIR